MNLPNTESPSGGELETASEQAGQLQASRDSIQAKQTPGDSSNEPSASLELCPACGEGVDVPADPILGEALFCDNCGAELEVIGTDPVRLDLFEDEEK